MWQPAAESNDHLVYFFFTFEVRQTLVAVCNRPLNPTRQVQIPTKTVQKIAILICSRLLYLTGLKSYVQLHENLIFYNCDIVEVQYTVFDLLKIKNLNFSALLIIYV